MHIKAAALAVAFALAPVTAALADRPPTDEERTQIEAALQEAGYSSWGSIEWDDDGYWEVDDAVDSGGVQFDLKLDEGLTIIEEDRED
jgi:polyisoprenoid-binding protein YceI